VTPGQRFSYSGEGFRLLQMVVEKVTDQSLQSHMDEAVFQPLGMTSSSFVWRPEYEQRKAFGHSFTGSSAGRARIPEAKAASSLETTAADYARFLLAFVRGTHLSPAIARQALQRQTGVEEGCVVCLGRPAGAAAPNISWGLGMGLANTAAGWVAWHWGDNNTMQAYAAIALDGSRGTVILTNSANGHSVAQPIAASLLGFEAPGYAWGGSYSLYTDPGRQALSRIVRRQPGAVAAAAGALSRSDAMALAERLLAGDRPAEAAALVRALSEPRTGPEYALLAEALRRAGRPAEARKAAAQALRLEPENKRAKEAVRRTALAERQVPTALLARYAGRYSSPFGPLDVTNDGGRLTARLLDQPPSAMLPMSDSTFLMEGMGVPIEFVSGADGRITHAIVSAGGEIRLPRVGP
jgi:CubicO group peptidase (beta-lactamase class C family)